MVELKKLLLKNPQHIKNILKKYEFHNITIGYKEVRCGVDEDTNATSVRIKLNDHLNADDYGRDIHGDLFSLIMRIRKVDLHHVMTVVKAEIGITHFEFTKKAQIFGGFYSNIKNRNQHNIELKTYDESILQPYLNKYNKKFLKDGISLSTQKKYKVGLCSETSRITVPWYSFEGELIGITGRYNGDYEKDEVYKWFPLIPFPKSQVLFGYNINYESLQNCEEIYIGESEKFPMQLDSMGINTSVAIGGNTIHTTQIKYLTWLSPKRIIFCLDEGLDEDVVLRQVDKVKYMVKLFGIQVGYVVDRENKLLPKGSKKSPSDLGIEIFKELVKNHVEWR